MHDQGIITELYFNKFDAMSLQLDKCGNLT
jgi:hypothetical protein